MDEDKQGFAADVDQLDGIANELLPAVANGLRAPIAVITAHEGLEGPGHFDAIYGMEAAYAHFTDSVGNRQRTGCERIDATAEALRDIIALYRRVDGQK